MRQHTIDFWKKQALAGLLMSVALGCMPVAQADTAPRRGGMMQWGEQERGGPYHGMMGWPDGAMGMMGGYGMHGYSGLDLSAEQMNKIDKIHDDTRKKHWELMGKIMDEAVRLRELRNAEKPDPAAIGKQYGKIQDMQRQMLEQSVDAENRVEALLTKEQRDRFRKMRRWGGGD